MSEERELLKGKDLAWLTAWIVKTANENGQPIDAPDVIRLIIEFERNFDAMAMFRYWLWALENEQKDGAILATIVHDLNGRFENPALFAPRTSSY